MQVAGLCGATVLLSPPHSLTPAGPEQETVFQESKLGDTLEEAKAAFDGLRTYLKTDKPRAMGDKLDVEALYAEIQVRSRPSSLQLQPCRRCALRFRLS